jgi:hypothetical protein
MDHSRWKVGMSRQEILHDIANLSSGTLATLTGLRGYKELDVVQEEFLSFAQKSIGSRRWRQWQDAWKEYERLGPHHRWAALKKASGIDHNRWKI